MKKILVMAVHPDDETLGCGGTLLKHQMHGDELHWLIATNTVQENGAHSAVVKQRNKEIERVRLAYGFKRVHSLNLPSKGVDTVPVGELVQRISEVITKIRPEIVYLPFLGDVHSDHRYFFHAAHGCTKTFRNPFIRTVLMMETLSETEFSSGLKKDSFIPNYFVDISDHLKDKIRIMSIYKSEMKKHPFPRSKENIKALALFRGATANCIYAESFMLLKGIV